MPDIKINRITNANVYLEGESLLGQVEECSLPEVKPVKADHKVLGLNGKAQFASGLDNMEMKLKWNSFYGDTLAKLGNPYKSLKLQVRGSLQQWEANEKTGEVPVVAFLRITSGNFPGFGFKQHENVEAESTFTVNYYKLEVDDVEVIEVDVLANIHKQNGVDLLADYRANLGI